MVHMSIDYVLQKIQSPDISSRDLTSHLLYYFNQLSGRSGFSLHDENISTVQHMVRTIVHHPLWNYEQSSSQITIGFYPDLHKTFSKEQQKKHALAFETFLDAIGETLCQRFVQEYLDVLQKTGAGHLPCVMKAMLTQEIGQAQSRISPLRKI